jgi:hypothetical protein
MRNTSNYTTPRLIPVTRWGEFFSDPSVPGLRWLIFSNPDFAKACILRRGRRLLVDVEAYESWLLAQNHRDSSSKTEK